MDDEQTVVTRAVRINPEYVGKGLYGYLDSYIGKWAKAKGVLTKAFTTSNMNSHITKGSFKGANTLIHKKVIYFKTTSTNNTIFLCFFVWRLTVFSISVSICV